MGRLVESISRTWDRLAHDEAPAMENAHQVAAWSNCDYHDRFLAYLREEADKPINPKLPHADLIVNNARANTMKEIRQHLLDLKERANAALERERG